MTTFLLLQFQVFPFVSFEICYNELSGQIFEEHKQQSNI